MTRAALSQIPRKKLALESTPMFGRMLAELPSEFYPLSSLSNSSSMSCFSSSFWATPRQISRLVLLLYARGSCGGGSFLREGELSFSFMLLLALLVIFFLSPLSRHLIGVLF